MTGPGPRRTIAAMGDKAKGPRVSATGAAEALRRQERLAAALRANLGRRKAQARERAAAPATEEPAKRSG